MYSHISILDKYVVSEPLRVEIKRPWIHLCEEGPIYIHHFSSIDTMHGISTLGKRRSSIDGTRYFFSFEAGLEQRDETCHHPPGVIATRSQSQTASPSHLMS